VSVALYLRKRERGPHGDKKKNKKKANIHTKITNKLSISA